MQDFVAAEAVVAAVDCAAAEAASRRANTMFMEMTADKRKRKPR